MLLAAAKTPPDTTPTWLVALVGALVAGLLALLGGWIQGNRERSRWLIEKRHLAYDGLLKQIDLTSSRISTKNFPKTLEERLEIIHPTILAVSEVTLLGPEYVIRASDVLRDALVAFLNSAGGESTAFHKARAAYISATRVALLITPWHSRWPTLWRLQVADALLLLRLKLPRR
jgi:hypothetical protein